MRFFLPKQSEFFDLFKKVGDCFIEITDLFYEFSQKFTDHEEFSKRAKEIEKKADSLTHQIIDGLNKTFVTPIDREDIYLLAHEFDDVIDLIENAMHNIYIYEIVDKIDEVVEFASLFKECALHLGELLQCIKKLKYSDEVMNLKIKVHELEDRGDIVYLEGIKRVFKESKDPIFTIKMKDILENLENTMDKCQAVSDIIEGIVIKST